MITKNTILISLLMLSSGIIIADDMINSARSEESSELDVTRRKHCGRCSCRPCICPPNIFNNYLFSYSDQTQTGSASYINVTFDNLILANNWTATSTSTFKATVAGTYLISYATTILLGNTTGGIVGTRLIRNGTEIPGSEIAGVLATTINLGKDVIVTLNAGDVISLQWSASGVTNPALATLTPIAATGTSNATSASLSIARIN